MSDDVLNSPMQNPMGKDPRRSISLDLTPKPYIAFPLECPICGMHLRSEFIQGLGARHTHDHYEVSPGVQCANGGKVYTVDSKLQVNQV